MRKLKVKAGVSIISVLIIFLVLTVFVGAISLHTVETMSGNAKIVNYAGIVRGGSQKLFKMELAGVYNDNSGKYGAEEIQKRDRLINRLSKIIDGLQLGDGGTWGSKEHGDYESFKFDVPDDKDYAEYMIKIQSDWAEIQNCIYDVRDGVRNPDELYDLTENYFILCNNMVAQAEKYSENQVTAMKKTLIAVIGIFVFVVVCAVVMMILSENSKRKAERLGKLAYTDALTMLNNRTACEKLIEKIKNRKPEEKKSLGVIMFDMNNLKLANDFLGHQGGDKIIRSFSDILNKTGEKYGMFTGRYGGDEFLVIAEDKEKSALLSFRNDVEQEIEIYNKTAAISIEKISFASGLAFTSVEEDNSIDELIYKADMSMYENKRSMKEPVAESIK